MNKFMLGTGIVLLILSVEYLYFILHMINLWVSVFPFVGEVILGIIFTIWGITNEEDNGYLLKKVE